jgi:hypothetical protein
MNDMTRIDTAKTEAFTHETLDCEGVSVDIIQLDGNIWFSAPAILMAMGFSNDGKNTSQRLQRVFPPDIIKVTDTPFRFTDSRRNRGSLISPRAVMQFAGKRVVGMNPIKATTVREWMMDEVLQGQKPEDCSPWVVPKVSLEPVYHEVIIAVDEDSEGRKLDPLRSIGPYWGNGHFGPLHNGEIDFEPRGRKMTFWRDDTPWRKPMDGEVIDDDDVF